MPIEIERKFLVLNDGWRGAGVGSQRMRDGILARFGDGLHAAFQPRETVQASWGRVREVVTEAGRDPASVRLSVRLYLDPEGSMPAAKSIAGSNAEMVDTIGRWAAIGVDHILLDPVASGGLTGRRAAMERFMLDVAPQV